LIEIFCIVAEAVLAGIFNDSMFDRIPKYVSEPIVIILLGADTRIPVIPPDLTTS
jgi:hypothetical protein